MDERRIEELAEDPRFIPGIYNYCDRWCERCTFTSRCMNYALARELESGDSQAAQDLENEAFWHKLHETFATTLEMIEEEAEEMEIDFDDEELEESIREQEEAHEAAQAQPYSRTAMRYIETVRTWFKSHEGLLDAQGDELEPLAQADVPGTRPADGVDLHDCLEVIRWYQPQIWVKLCRAAGGTIRAELEEIDCFQEDADGSAKVALIGIERSIAAWATLLRRFPDHEDAIHALATLKRLLRQVEAAFPNARAFRRPGFDTTEKETRG